MQTGEIPLVAYQEYYRQDDIENRTTWKKGILVNPKLLLSVPDSLIEIESGYTINQSANSIRVGKRRTYSGFAISDRIFIVAIVTNNEEKIPRIKAEILLL